MDTENKTTAPAGEYKEEEKVEESAETSTAGADEKKDESAEKSANESETATPKAGDACTCPDGSVGTLSESTDSEGNPTLVCLANQGE